MERFKSLNRVLRPVSLALIAVLIMPALTVSCQIASPEGQEVQEGQKEQASEESEARLIVTRDFGCKEVLDKSVPIEEGESALGVLRRMAEVKTRYGGGFVSGINGVVSEYPESNEDWLYYVNGVLANVGAGSYDLCAGDVEFWDFHAWGFYALLPAVIGCFPQPFLSGYGGEVYPTVVVYQDGFEESAGRLRRTLLEEGVEGVSIQKHVSSSEKEGANLILLGTPDLEMIAELSDSDLRKLGLFVKFEQGEAILFDSQGEETRVKSCGVIQATQNPWNPKGIGAAENVVWMVSGTGKSHVEEAVDVLIDRAEGIQQSFAVAIIDGEVMKLPDAGL